MHGGGTRPNKWGFMGEKWAKVPGRWWSAKWAAAEAASRLFFNKHWQNASRNESFSIDWSSKWMHSTALHDGKEPLQALLYLQVAFFDSWLNKNPNKNNKNNKNSKNNRNNKNNNKANLRPRFLRKNVAHLWATTSPRHKWPGARNGN